MEKPSRDTNVSELRKLPQVDRLASALPSDVPARLRVKAARAAIAEASKRIGDGDPAPAFEQLLARSESLLRLEQRRRLSPVINATGVILHTNLGRAPLSARALDAAREVGAGYSNLEFDLERRRRGSRYEHAQEALAHLTGAEGGLVVNNNAGAVLLSVAALAQGREVIVSRGELIEIGGEFRIPEIIAQSGSRLREVGTTNRTRLKDYEEAIGPDTGAILKVHPSNYQIIGFTASVTGRELGELCRNRGLRYINDIGSGLLTRRVGGTVPAWLSEEPCASEAVAEGADAVTFSGDKLLGGPQAGIIVGRRDAIDLIRSSSLLRALRVDKLTLAALGATLDAYLAGEETNLPVWSMALSDPSTIRSRAEQVCAALPTDAAAVTPGFSTTGGGSAPGSRIPTWLVRISPRSCTSEELAERLVQSDPPVIARIEADLVVLDLRTVVPDDDSTVASSLSKLL
ncbi:MAG: L-seryl-tRNA(Sec) selenium transferase [Actinomycetota bacterium]|nr:L-seryl-tRNA(Sec) selenium transferase [Actinomycetota bacterium]